MSPKSPPDITAFDIANWFLAKAQAEGRPLKHMKLQKLVYFAYGWYSVSNDLPLFQGEFYAWRRGIVVRSLYETHKIFGDNPIIIEDMNYPDFDENAVEILESVWANYSPFSDAALGRAIRRHSSWRKAYASFEWEVLIMPETIQECFKGLAEQYENAQA